MLSVCVINSSTKYKTKKLFRVSRPAPMVCKSADGTEEKIAGKKAVCAIYGE